jgi:uncharacterized protein (TIGR02147 family)
MNSVFSGANTSRSEHPVEWLRGVYLKRKGVNPRYSLRAFAKSLEMNSGRLSEILTHKRPLTLAMGERIAHRLKLEQPDLSQFYSLIKSQRQQHSRIKTLDRGSSHTLYQTKTIGLDQFRLIADWQHFALLALMRTQTFNNNFSWMAERLGTSVGVITQSIKRLLRLGLVVQHQGRLSPSEHRLATPREIASPAIQKAHKQNLHRAAMTLERVPVELRDFSYITMAIDTSKLDAAKEYIQEFRRRMATLLETADADEVYTLSVQLYPISHKGHST